MGAGEVTGLLYELGLSRRWVGTKTLVDLHLPVVIRHYDLSSLFAGKMHALLMRKYTKGRDVYDLFWYGFDVSIIAKEYRAQFEELKKQYHRLLGEFNYRKGYFAEIHTDFIFGAAPPLPLQP